MKFSYLLLLLIAPALCEAQSQSAVRAHRNELLLNLGTAGSSAYEPAKHGLDWKAPKRAAIGVLHNAGPLQYGIQLEAGSESAEQFYVAPSLTGNYCVRYRHGYGYAGISAGYYLNSNTHTAYGPASALTHGYQVGAQTGYVQYLGSRFAISGEIAFRHVIRWTEQFEWYPTSHNPAQHGGTYEPFSQGYAPETSILIPLTIGVRYRL